MTGVRWKQGQMLPKAFQYMMGLQDRYGHGKCKNIFLVADTDVDSHLDLPVIPHTRARLDSIELLPFPFVGLPGL